MNKVEIRINPKIVEKEVANSNGRSNKVYIEFPLLRTYPAVNKNGDTYDYDKTKEVHDSVNFGYINLEHEQWINVGTVINSEFEEGNIGTIKCEAVLWKSALEEFDISVDDIKEGKFAISMEVYFQDYYVMLGKEKVDLPEAEEYLEYAGQTYEDKEVARVIIPQEYSGAALTENPADKTLDINKIVASKLEDKGISKEELKDIFANKVEDLKNEEVQKSMYKQFETEKEFNDFLESQRNGILEEIKEDEEVINQITAGYVEVDEILNKFEGLGLEDIDSLDTAVEGIEGVMKEFAQFKQEVAQERKLNERKQLLKDNGIELEKLEASEEDLLEMTDKSIEIIINGFKEAQKVTASVEKDNDSEGFDPTGVNVDEDDLEIKDIINAL